MERNGMQQRGEALVTGASSGIGAAFARRLAAAGHNLILVARREERLRRLGAELERAHSIAARVAAADLADPAGLEQIERLAAGAANIEYLVNNAGFGIERRFADTDPAAIKTMNRLHVGAPAALCRAVLPGMIARRRGAIINVSSIAGFIPMPRRANYAATKAYLTALTQALQQEVAGMGIAVQALCPGFTRTEFHDTEEFAGFDRAQVPPAFWMEADEVVAASLRALQRGRVVVIPGALNRILVAAFRNPLTAPLLKAAYRLRRRRQASAAAARPSDQRR